jgi:two-component system CheB/CheR fusion protein
MKLVEEKLLKISKENRLLIDSSYKVILKMSADWKLLEFNTAAETFFGKKREDVTGQDFMKLFIPEPLRKKTEQKMTSLLTKSGNNTVKMKVIADGPKELNIAWSVNVLFDRLELSSAIITITKK